MFGLFKRKKDTYQNIGLEAFNKMRQQQDTLVIDVRNPKEIASSAVPGHVAINISQSDFKEKAAALDPSKTYLIYCRSGMRSAKACRIMSDMGFESLYNFKGGIIEWNAAQ